MMRRLQVKDVENILSGDTYRRCSKCGKVVLDGHKELFLLAKEPGDPAYVQLEDVPCVPVKES